MPLRIIWRFTEYIADTFDFDSAKSANEATKPAKLAEMEILLPSEITESIAAVRV